jgi:DNA polymerase III delta prime subunit
VLSQSKSKQGFPARPNAAHTIIEPPHKNSANKNGQTFKAGLKESDHGAKAAEIVDGVKEPLMALKHASPLNVVTTTNTVDNKPKRILRLNPKTGTIGSPPKKQTPAADSALKKTSSRGKKKSKIVTIQYAPGLQGVGAKIDQILRSTKQVTSLPEAPRTPKKAPTLPSKSTHPFFLGKAAPKRSTPPKKSKQNGNIDFKESLSPHRLQYPPLLERLQPNGKSSGPFFTSGFSNAAKAVKIPGAIEPAWPWKGMLHIRGEISDPAFTDPLLINPLNMQITAKKSKFNATQIPDIENIMKIKARDLHISDIVESIQYNNPDEFDPPPISLRPAVKHNESAMKIQRRVLKELHYRNLLSSLQKIDILSEDGISVTKSNQPKIHPSLLNIYTSITTSLSAFDKGQCDVQDWAHKYSPQRAAEVLQDGNEAFILKDWLQALIVNSVEGGAAQALRTRTSSLAKRASKRKRKSIKLDGFIVSSGEEEFDPDEISEADSESSLNNNRRRTKKTFVQSGLSKEAGKLDNAILISGPSGSGKTASVYAAAKELGFEVFEISSNSRRNGKDIMDKVGDMTRNHLVHRSAAPAPAQLFNAEEEKSNDALADDLKSGRQGVVNSFFITKQTPQSTVTAGSKQSPREQKQSLILIEEVDVLYKEDTQFWATITNLIQSSKRPIVMTCNDESVIESMNLALYGILRFTPPPTDLAVDYMICLAACEGHVLERAAVRSLYEIRHQDLRASIMDLNFWCRFGVGSIKGGLDWYLPRAHGGRDFDESGNALRVVSEGTYQPGMGFLNQDFFQSHVDHLEVEEEMLAEIWEGWQLDVSHWQENLNMGAWANKMQQLSTGRQDKCATLGLYEEFVEAMSDADMCSHGALALGDRVSFFSLNGVFFINHHRFLLAPRLRN